MARAREAILRARRRRARQRVHPRCCWRCSAFIPWRAVPVMPVEIMLLPRWFPFHLDKISYWAAPSSCRCWCCMALKPRARNPQGRHASTSCSSSRRDGSGRRRRRRSRRPRWFWFFRGVDIVLRAAEPLFPKAPRQRAIDARGGLGDASGSTARTASARSIPAMANSVMMFDALGYPRDHPQRAIARRSIEKLLVVHDARGLLPALRLAGLGHRARLPRAARGRRRARAGAGAQGPRLAASRCRSSTSRATGRRGGPTCGRAAGRSNTPIRIIPMSTTPRWWRWRWTARRARADRATYRAPIARAREWIVGMQSRNGGWGAFDADNEYYYLNNIPFADHGALLDPPTEDVTARCVSMLAQLGETRARTSPAVARGDRLSAPHAACRTAAGTAAGA